MRTQDAEQNQNITSSDVLLANQLLYTAQVGEYDKKNHVQSQAIHRYYRRLFEQYIFSGLDVFRITQWKALDIGCGTGFLEGILKDYQVGSIVALDGTLAMLQAARQKLANSRTFWLQSDAARLPFRTESFDLVCLNALLHHVYDYHQVLEVIVSCLKPGGKLFVGYEPNAIPYKFLRPLLLALAQIAPEQRKGEIIRKNSSQDLYPKLRAFDIHKLSEFHIFHGKGIHPYSLQDFLQERGFVNTKLHFTSLYQVALLRDLGVPIPVDLLPEWLCKLTGRMSLSFSLTSSKAPG